MLALMHRAERFLKPLFWVALAFTFYSAVAPAGQAPALHWWDKAQHMIAFAVLTLLAAGGYRARPLGAIAAALLGFGVAIELVQGLAVVGRDASVADVVADGVAIAATTLIALPLRRWLATTIEAEGGR